MLIVIGIIIILFTVFNIYGVFSKRSKPIQFFNFSGVSINTGEIISQNMPELTEELAEYASDKSNTSEETEIIPPDLINDTSNLVAHLVLMSFILNAGFKLSSIGTMLARPIVVKIKTKNTSAVNSSK